MAHEVFISYRKSISKDQAQILKLKIDEYFGKDTAFLDNDDLQIGDQWAEKLSNKLAQATQIISVIGKDWTKCSFDHTDRPNGIRNGQRRIDHPEDWVCKEIEAGCKEDKIFAVFMGGATIGEVNSEDMPDEKPYLSAFFQDIQAFCISDAHQKHEFIPIFEKLEQQGIQKKIVPPPPPPPPSSAVTLHDFHKYTCDRRAQLGAFVKAFEANKAQKTQFYYVMGKEEQAHFGFVNRVAYEQGGHLLDVEGINHPTSKLEIEEIVLEYFNGIGQLKKQLVRELMARLEINVNTNDPILEKNLAFICQESPIIQQMESSDFVSFQISIYEDEWDEEDTPALARWFIYEFCGLPHLEQKEGFQSFSLPNNAPTFLFFFSIIFEEGDSDILEMVKAEVNKGHSITLLPKLNMVAKKDITRWFRKYKIIAPDEEVRNNLMETHFSDTLEHKMSSVQRKLQKLIDRFNGI